MRVRLIFQAVENESLHLNNDYLSLGLHHKGKCLHHTQLYCLYSGDNYVTSLRLTNQQVRCIYHSDILRIAKSGGWMGIWQFHQTAEMLGIPVASVYPQETNSDIRRDMNHMILPRNTAFHCITPTSIMWTPASEYSAPHKVNHFVPLLNKRGYKLFQTY